jgi:YegS/Rv2252/BmrU family lipid kinase
MSRSACLIFNPVAGQGNPDQDLARILELLASEIDLDICRTTEEIGADQLACKAVERGAEMIIASGGDGTLSAAAEALVGTDIPFGVISRGTANAFATALGIPDTIEAACQTILGGITRTVDAASCNGKPMVLLVGIGFEAEAVERANRNAKNRFGMLAYVLAGLQQLRNLSKFSVEIETEDKVIQVSAASVTIANAAPPTSILAQGPAGIVVDDGLLDLTVVAPANMAGAIAASYHLLQSALNENPVERPDIGYLRARKIKVTADPPQKVVLDGELVGSTPVEVECIPGGLKILVPETEVEMPAEKLDGLPDLEIISKGGEVEEKGLNPTETLGGLGV